MLGLKHALRKKLALKVSKYDQHLLEDPYISLGYGIHAYLQIMKDLILMMSIITLLAIPLLVFYSKFDALYNDDVSYSLNQYTLGNLGGANTVCEISSM